MRRFAVLLRVGAGLREHDLSDRMRINRHFRQGPPPSTDANVRAFVNPLHRVDCVVEFAGEVLAVFFDRYVSRRVEKWT